MPSFYVQAAGGDASTMLPAADLPHPDLGAGPHLGYAVQWFGFATAMLAGYTIHVRRQERRTR